MTKLFSYLLGLGLALSASSCALLGSRATTVSANPDSGVAPLVSTQAKSDKQSSTSRPKSASSTVANTKKANTHTKTSVPEHRTSSVGASETELGKRLGGEWTIVAVGDRVIMQDDDMPYVNFDLTKGRFYASNGCNILNGDFTTKGSTIAFANVISTMRLCPDIDYEIDINAVLQNGITVKTSIEKRDNATYLYLSSPSGALLMTLLRHDLDFLNGQWVVTEIEGEKIDDDEVNIFFDIPELKVHGNTGCNYFNGAIRIDPLVPNSISFSQMGVTMRLCDNGDIERSMLVALEQTATYSESGHHTVHLLDDNAHRLMTIKKK